MSLLVLCPSRGRPQKAAESLESFLDTRTDGENSIVYIVDADDPTLPEYLNQIDGTYLEVSPPLGNMCAVLNASAMKHVAMDVWDHLGFVGDDHRFRTRDWDRILTKQLDEVGGGLAYANDLNWQNGEIPTSIIMSTIIVKALGWMGLPTAKHLYLDNAWRVIGESIERLYYFPQVVIEHVHPAYSKTEWDEGYLRVNSEKMYADDRAAFEAWLADGVEADLGRVVEALGMVPA